MTEAVLTLLSPSPMVTQPVAIFLVVLSIILIAPIVLRYFKIPTIIGLIIAGVAVGPYGFNVLARDMSFEVFGQVGILYLMFLAGLEIDMYHLKKNVGRGAAFGLYTFVIPLLAGAAVSHWLLGLPWLASWLAASMFSAHTLIGYPIVSRFGLTKSPAVVIAIAGTIVTVLLSLIVLGSVVGVYHDGSFRMSSTLRLLVNLMLFCAVTGYVYPRLTRWFFKKHIDGITQFVYVLAMAFLAATVATWIGIEGVFGAFFAGLTLNRYIPSRSSLMGRIEFVGNAIFIPYFLIGVGMLINVRVILEGWATLYVATVMSLAAIACKWLAAFATQVTFGMGRVSRSMMFQLSNAHTAVALAVVMIGYDMGVFDENLLNGTVLMILVTCTVASIGVERAASRLALSGSEQRLPSAAPGVTNHALISVATPITAQQLVGLAILMRPPSDIDSKLYALHVRADNSPGSKALGRHSLDVAEQAAVSTDTPLTAIERYDINVVTGLLNTVAERDVSSIFLGLHRRSGIADTFYGDKIEQLLRMTHRMVVMSRIFIPVNTVRRIYVVVPHRAQFESGFSRWVDAVGNLARQTGCRVAFHCFADARDSISRVLTAGRYGIRYDFVTMERGDDYVLLAGEVETDDLVVFISARRQSISYSADVEDMTSFMRRCFADGNLIVIFPEQFGEHPDIPTMADTMTPDTLSAPSRLWTRVAASLRRKPHPLPRD